MNEMPINYANLFEEYWANRGRYLGINNSTRTYNSLHEALKSCRDIGDIDDYVCSKKSGKESTRRIIVDYLKYVEDKTGCSIDSSLFNNRIYSNVVERQLEIAKFLHTPKDVKEIEEQFNISIEIRKKDLRALKEGVELLGSKITLEEQRMGRKPYYKCTVHPVFLPLNLTEIYALVKYLPGQLDPEDPNSVMIRDIIRRIDAQLSDYAWEKIYPDSPRPAYLNDYISDQQLAQSRKGIRMYLMKSSKECSFFWNGDEYRGRISHDMRIQLSDGSYLDADLNEVDFIIDSFEYE